MIGRDILLVATALLVGASRHGLSAQTCTGRSDFRGGPVDVGASAGRTTNATSVDGRVALGSSGPASVALTLATIDYDNSAQGASAVALEVGYGIPLGADRTVSVCPVLGASYRFGPKVEETFGFVDVHETVLNFGASIGTAAELTPSLTAVPFIGLAYYLHTPTINTNVSTESGTYSYPRLDLGTGVIFNRSLTLRPIVSIPMNSNEVHTRFELSFSVNFGGN